MFRKLLLASFFSIIIGCTSKKRTVSVKNPKPQVVVITSDSTEEVVEKVPETIKEPIVTNTIADNIVATAMDYAGVRYRFGGTTKGGMDCSGLVYVALKENEIPFPRTSYEMSHEGEHIKLRKVKKGDLLFFNTEKRGRRVNHVGLVVAVDGDEIKFIHSTSSRGVIVSSLREGYWNYAFVKAARIL